MKATSGSAMGNDADEDGPIELSSAAMAALQSFLRERSEAQTETDADPDPFRCVSFSLLADIGQHQASGAN